MNETEPRASPARLALPALLLAAAAAGVAAGRLTAPASSAPEDRERVERVLRDSLDRQAELNRAILDQNRQVADASRKLVESDAAARRELVALNREVQAERGALVRMQEAIQAERAGLDAERGELARERRREPVLAAAVEALGGLLAFAAVALLCARLVRRLGPSDGNAALAELVIRDVASADPVLLPPAPAPALPPKAAAPLPPKPRA